MSNQIGTIHSIALQDFLTYDAVVFKPGKHLNIIIGPNGSGKSTIVAGLILGCGGKPQVLSRSKDIADYIKNGKTKAHIEIDLIKNQRGDLLTLHRSFDRSGRETYSIDGKKVSAKAYLETIHSYNIQVDNLCMFLPQDRVQDFTKLNPQEILNNTQISVCSPEINGAFDELKAKREKQINSAQEDEGMRARLKEHETRYEKLHSMIENNREKQRLIAEIDLHRKKKIWLEYDALKKQFDEANGDIKKLKDSIEKKNQALKPLIKRQAEIAGTKNDLKEAINKSEAKMSKAITEIDKSMNSSRNLQSDIGKAKQEFKNIITTAKDHEKEIKELELYVSIAKKDYENAKESLGDEGDLKAISAQFDEKLKNQKKRIEGLMKEIQSSSGMLDYEIESAINNSKRKIAKMKDIKSMRFNVLQTRFEAAWRAQEFIERNRESFKGTVFSPIMSEITVKDKRFAKYIENTVAVRDLEMFLCTDKDDMERLILKLRNEMKLMVNIGYTEDTDEIQYESTTPIEEFPKSLGLYKYLIDVIEGPAPVINYLCSLYNIHNTPIGDDRTAKNTSKLPNHIRLFFATNQRFSVNISKYTAKKSVTSSTIFEHELLNTGIDQALIAREEENIQKLQQEAERITNEKNKRQRQIMQLEAVVQELRAQKSEAITKIRSVQTLLEKFHKKEVELEKMKNSRINIEEERKKCKNRVDDIVRKILESNERSIKMFEVYANSFIEKNLGKKKLSVFDSCTGNIDEQIDDLRKEIARIQDTCMRATGVCDNLKSRMDAKEREALELSNGEKPTSKNYKEKFNKLPDTVLELQDKIDDMQGRMECIPSLDPQVTAEYEERREAISELRHQISTKAERAIVLEKKIEELHNIWYPEILRVVSSINKNFSNFFAKMGFVGEVELIRKDERDYNEYGIQIRVQYRDNEKLEALNRHVQSGGERAVAISVYTLSLQHLTMVPFRCVDEINQGMDPRNERKIFQMLVDITCQPGQSQYFFITPKLLPDLPYHELMTVAIVYNGEYVSDPCIFDGESEDAQQKANSSDDEESDTSY